MFAGFMVALVGATPAGATGTGTSGVAVNVLVNLPVATIGTPYSALLTIAPRKGSLLGPGCYRILAGNLPAGLHLASSTLCTSKKEAASLSAQIEGTPVSESGPLFPVSVDFTVLYLGVSSHIPLPSAAVAAAPVAGFASRTLLETPPYLSPQVGDQYAGLALTHIFCPAHGECVVTGESHNPKAVAQLPRAGSPPAYVPVLAGAGPGASRLLEGGAFIARVRSINPLSLSILRSGIAGSFAAFSCTPDAAYCVGIEAAASSNYSSGTSLLVMGKGGATWNAMELSTAGGGPGVSDLLLDAVACPVANSCLLGGSGKVRLPSSARGATTHPAPSFTPGTGTGSGPATANTAALTPVGVVINGDPASVSSLFTHIHLLTGLADSVGAIACSSAQICMAAGGAFRSSLQSGVAGIVLTMDGGSRWENYQAVALNPDPPPYAQPAPQPYLYLGRGEVPFGPLSSMGCAEGLPMVCTTVWPAWPAAVASLWDGTQWLPGLVPPIAYGLADGLSGPVACSSRSHCFLLSNPVEVCSGGVPCLYSGILENSQDGQFQRWGLAGLGPVSGDSPHLADIACQPAGQCLAVGNWSRGGSALRTVFPLVMRPQDPARVVSAVQPSWQLPSAVAATAVAVVSVGAGLRAALSVVPALGYISAGTGVVAIAVGLPACISGTAAGCIAVGLGAVGVLTFPLRLLLFVVSGEQAAEKKQREAAGPQQE